MPEQEIDLLSLDFGGFGEKEAASYLQPIMDRAEATVRHFKPITVPERLEEFAAMGYRPSGIYLPTDKDLSRLYKAKLAELGDIEDDADRLKRYFSFQDDTGQLEIDGVPGRWTGQQGIGRSPSRYRIVVIGRRGGKTYHSAREIAAVMRKKPGSMCWVCGRTMESVSRCFDEVAKFLTSLGHRETAATWRDNDDEKLIVLQNGSRCEGKSLEASVAGLGVDLVVVEEAKEITEEQWEKHIRPPLAEKMGRALIISSLDAIETFFYQEYLRAKKRREADLARGVDPEWDYFKDATWDVNFFAFPQGRQSPGIKSEERDMSARTFLREFGAVPMASDLLVYPEYRTVVHTGQFAWDPRHPVIVLLDPSGGANPYAGAIIQDYGEKVIQIDEIYETGSTGNAEAVDTIMRNREWCLDDLSNIRLVLADSAAADDIRRLGNMGWPIEAVYDKPEVWMRLPIMRNMLRVPALFNELLDFYTQSILIEMGYPEGTTRKDMDPDDEGTLLMQLEEALADENLSEEDIANMRLCSRFFINENCFNTINEFLTYQYNANRNLRNVREKPREHNDHIMDAVGYYFFQYKRFDDDDTARRSVEVNLRGHAIILNRQPDSTGADLVTIDPIQPPDTTYRGRMTAFMDTVRNHFDEQAGELATYSMLERA